MTPPRRHWAWLLLATITLASAAAAARWWQSDQAHLASLVQRLDSRQAVRTGNDVACVEFARLKPLVLLVLGQSNAGNHGPAPVRTPAVRVHDRGRCALAVAPLPGATGAGDSVWTRLPDELARLGIRRPVVFSLVAVDATSMDDWVRADGPLAGALAQQVQALREQGLAPSLVLWQQGEADARDGTTTTTYTAGLTRLGQLLGQYGLEVPVVLARSTVCRGAPSQAVRAAIEGAASPGSRWRLGPDIDTLTDAEFRHDGCHLSVLGLDLAARLWAESLHHALPTLTN